MDTIYRYIFLIGLFDPFFISMIIVTTPQPSKSVKALRSYGRGKKQTYIHALVKPENNTYTYSVFWDSVE